MQIAVLLLALLNDDIDAFTRKALAVAGAPPGLTIVVVKNDRVVYRGDFGLRDVEQNLPVTPDTRFYVASSTKAFTAMAALVLAEEGKLDLDAPVSSVWKELGPALPAGAKQLSLRDLLAMRPGFENDTLNFRSGALANIPDETELLRIVSAYSTEQPRIFDYSNMSYVLAAKIIEHATAKTWQDLSAEKVFTPLGMTSATSRVPADGVPLYRSTARGVFVRNRPKLDATMGPAGGTFVTSDDAAKWVIAMLNDGVIAGRQALPKRAVRMAQSAQTTHKAQFHYFARWAWGLGEDLGDYEGDLFVHRFGGYNGAFSHISFMPDRRIGVVVFSNGGSAVADAIAAYACDRVLGKKNLDEKWSAELAKVAAATQKARDDRAAADAAVIARAAARPLAEYAGAYFDHRLGALQVDVAGDRLIAQLGVLRAELIPAGGDEFFVDFENDGGWVKAKFVFEETGTRFDWEGRVFHRAATSVATVDALNPSRHTRATSGDAIRTSGTP